MFQYWCQGIQVVVCIVADGRKAVNPRVLDCLAALGVYQEGQGIFISQIHCWHSDTLTNRCNDEHSKGSTGHSACFRIHDQFCSWWWFTLQISRQRHCSLPDYLLHEREKCELGASSCMRRVFVADYFFRPKRSTPIDGSLTPSRPCYQYVSFICSTQRMCHWPCM